MKIEELGEIEGAGLNSGTESDWHVTPSILRQMPLT